MADGGDGGGAALGSDSFSLLNSGWSPLLLGHGGAQTVEPLLLVVDVVDVQGVGLAVGWIQRAHTKDVLGYGGTQTEKEMQSTGSANTAKSRGRGRPDAFVFLLSMSQVS